MTQETGRGDLSRESLQRLTGFLLAVAAALFSAVIGLSLYIVMDKRDMAELRGSLLAQQQLQRELLARQDSDHAPYPHLDPGISYVLNPAMQQATWKTGAQLPYRINRLGLRGKQIKAKPDGLRRIALVGDSVLFGWQLADEDRLAEQLQALADLRFGPGNYEFITIALPGWNIRDQDHFLRSHLARLDPDYIIWSIIRNDLLDSAGVIPPGMLAAWNSPHKQREQPFQFLPPARLRDAPAPAILSRWIGNLQRIDTFAREFDIPTSLLWWRARHRQILDHVMAKAGIELPVVYIPGQYRYDEANWCVAPPDCHPTRWANERLAIGILDELMHRQAMPSRAWPQAEQLVADAFRQERAKRHAEDEQRAFLLAQIDKLADHYDAADPGSVIFGVRDGRMQRNGLLLLRGTGAVAMLELEIAPLWQRPGPPLQVDIRVRDSQDQEVAASYTLDAASQRIRMSLSPDRHFGLYQVEWQFSYSECERPSACYSARLLGARLLDEPQD